MARPKQNPTERFRDIIPLWTAVEQQGGVVFSAPNSNTAINIVYRLNQYRKLLREDSEYGYTALDGYVVQRDGYRVVIKPRPSYDLSTMRTLDGRPIESLQATTINNDMESSPSFDTGKPPTIEEQKMMDAARALARKNRLID
jgi:hypothetical protein